MKNSSKLSVGLGTALASFLLLENAVAQSVTITPGAANTIQTSNSTNYIDLKKTGTNTFAGFRFLQNQSVLGVLFYNDDQNVINLSNASNSQGLIWNNTSQRVGIGVNAPDARLHILTNSTGTVPHLLVQENNNSDGARINFENFGVARTWTLYGKNSSSTVPSDNVLNIYHSSFGNIARFTGDGNTQLNGFTQLGADAPKIKVKKFTGILNNDASTSIVTAFTDFSKIVSYTGYILRTSIPQLAINPNEEDNDFHYVLRLLGNAQNIDIIFSQVPSVLRGQTYTVYITYEE